MSGECEQALRDCMLQLNQIQEWIEKNKLDSIVRFLVSYAVVKSCGTIETVLKQVVFNAVSDGAKPEAKSFLTKNILEASFNPSPGQIFRILEQVNERWKEKLMYEIKGDKDKGQLSSLVELRNSFAHGDSITASIGEVKEYFQAGIRVLYKLDRIMEE